jgi:hypothetical protein
LYFRQRRSNDSVDITDDAMNAIIFVSRHRDTRKPPSTTTKPVIPVYILALFFHFAHSVYNKTGFAVTS